MVEGKVVNYLISAARSVWYWTYEPIALRILRMTDAWPYDWWGDDNPLVSIYVPTHNRRELLEERCINSILAQTHKNWELIICAHDCTDSTISYVWTHPDQRIRVVRVPRKEHFPYRAENYWFSGRVDPSNAGLAACRGEWIATNDDDDVWTPDHLERLLKYAYYGKYEFVSGGATGPDGPIKPYNLNGVKVGGVQTWMYRSYLKVFKFNRQSWRKSWNKVCDTDIQQRFRNSGVKMGYLDRSICTILPRPGETHIGLRAYVRDAGETEKHFGVVSHEQSNQSGVSAPS